MKVQKNPAEEKAISRRREVPRKAYEKPSIIYRARLEAMAGQCDPFPVGKANPAICVTTLMS